MYFLPWVWTQDPAVTGLFTWSRWEDVWFLITGWEQTAHPYHALSFRKRKPHFQAGQMFYSGACSDYESPKFALYQEKGVKTLDSEVKGLSTLYSGARDPHEGVCPTAGAQALICYMCAMCDMSDM